MNEITGRDDIIHAIHAYTNGQTKGYNQLVGLLQVDAPSKEFLIICLDGLIHSLPFIERNHENLIGAILRLDWLVFEKPLSEKYVSFVLELISSKSYYVSACLSSVVKKLIPKNVPTDSDCEYKDEQQFASLRNIIINIIHIAPVAEKYLNDHIKKYFPYIGKPTYILNSYITNILKLCIELSAKSRYNTFALCIDRLLMIDVKISREELENIANDELQFEVDTQNEENTNVEKLDMLLSSLFTFFCTIFSPDHQNLYPQHEAIYHDVMHVFNDVILKTQQSSHVQFVLFYINSFDKKYTKLFLTRCWDIFQNPNNAQMTRQCAASYIASFIARANFVEKETVKEQLEKLSRWIHKYLDNQDTNNMIADGEKHLPFYSACQATFYIFIYHHKYFVGNEKLKKFILSLNFLRMITSKLNPLKFCLDPVVELFARITRMYEIAFCYSVIERNKRNAILESFNNGGVSSKAGAITMFFPFDPYLLRKSSSFINGLYLQWVDETNVFENDSKDDQDTSDLDDSDDNILPESFDMMCISPGFQSHMLSKSPHYL